MRQKKTWNWNRLVAMLLMAACLISVLPVLNRVEAVDLTNCSVTAAFAQTQWLEDLPADQIQIDLYRVAAAVPVAGYDAYEFQADAPYQGLDLGAEDQEALAQNAAEIALSNGTVTKSGVAMTEISELDGGLYLLIAHGADLLSPADYRIAMENGNLATIANSSTYQYAFLPQLISLPSRGDDAGTSSADPTSWNRALTVTLKATRTERFGSLEIVKTLLSYETSDTATFVFRVVAEKDGQEVYRDVVDINFNSAGVKSSLVDRIPAGASVTVTEVYSGSSYRMVASDNAARIIEAGNTVQVSFTNDYDGPGPGGHGVNNHFEYSSNSTDDNSSNMAGWQLPVATMD